MSSFISFCCEVREGSARPRGRAGFKVAVPLAHGRSAEGRPGRGRHGRQAGAKGTCGPYPPAVSTALVVVIGNAANGAIEVDRPGASARGGIGTLRCPQRMPQNAVAALECVPVMSAPSVRLPPSLATLSVVASIPWHFMRSTSPQPTTQRCNHRADTLAERSNAFRAPERTRQNPSVLIGMSREFYPLLKNLRCPGGRPKLARLVPGWQWPSGDSVALVWSR
jgi:hypothetical protein